LKLILPYQPKSTFGSFATYASFAARMVPLAGIVFARLAEPT
jgi:hypothetical protein